MTYCLRWLSTVSLPLLILGGCATLRVPTTPVQSSQVETAVVQTSVFFNASNASLPYRAEWWSGFQDETLTTLIQQALAENKQLDVATANIGIASALLRREALEQSYDLSSDAGTSVGRTAGPDRSTTLSLTGGLNASWEWDAFGRIAAAIKAAELNVEAAEQARQDVAVIVASETALAYTDLRGAQQRLQVARDNAELQSQSLDLLRDLLENGRATDLDVNRAEAQYRTTLATLPQFEATIDESVSRLAVLTGQNASAAKIGLRTLTQQQGVIPTHAGALITGSPEELLRRRPDIRVAETEIAQLIALSDVERARLFPTITFDANVFALFNGSNRLDQLSSLGFGFGPALQWEGPDLRRVRADIDIADAETKLAYAQYEETVLQALSDVEIALSNNANELRRRQDLIKAAEASRLALELAQLRFEEGLDDFLDVLDAQRTVLDNEDDLAQSRLETTRLAILTYRELGGL